MRIFRTNGETVNAETTWELFEKIERGWPRADASRVFLDKSQIHDKACAQGLAGPTRMPPEAPFLAALREHPA